MASITITFNDSAIFLRISSHSLVKICFRFSTFDKFDNKKEKAEKDEEEKNAKQIASSADITRWLHPGRNKKEKILYAFFQMGEIDIDAKMRNYRMKFSNT